jgi:putative hemolysin
MTQTFFLGDRVKWADVTERSVPSYANMRGTVVPTEAYCTSQGMVGVKWDCDGGVVSCCQAKCLILATD